VHAELRDTRRRAADADQDSLTRHRWGRRIAGQAAALLAWPTFTDSEPPPAADTHLELASCEACFLLEAGPMLQAPICFEHAHAAADVQAEAQALMSRWFDRALGYTDDDEPQDMVRAARDVDSLRGVLAQALIGISCSSA
jgi:hypothetical protein